MPYPTRGCLDLQSRPCSANQVLVAHRINGQSRNTSGGEIQFAYKLVFSMSDRQTPKTTAPFLRRERKLFGNVISGGRRSQSRRCSFLFWFRALDWRRQEFSQVASPIRREML